MSPLPPNHPWRRRVFPKARVRKPEPQPVDDDPVAEWNPIASVRTDPSVQPDKGAE